MLKNKKGFSLIEVLVTVGLIGILVSIALPSYNKYKRNTLTMAVKADLANGHKAYNAYSAANGTFCAPLEDAGMNILMTSPTYRKGGFYGFGGVNVDCGGAPVHRESATAVKGTYFQNHGYCRNTEDGTEDSTHSTETACNGAAMRAWENANAFTGDAGACVLGADSFDLGAYTGTANVNTFFVINEAGKVHSKHYNTGTGTNCEAVPE